MWRRILAFNLVFVPAAVLAVAIIALLAQQQLQALGEKEVVENAKIMIETARASRHYTTEQIAPLLDKQQQTIKQLAEAVRTIVANAKKQGSHQVQSVPSATKGMLGVSDSGELVLPHAEFHPQSIPFYAATEAFNYFRHKYLEFGYKEATLNPTNLRDRAVDWEADVIAEFQKNESETEVIGHRSTPIGSVLFISAPIRVDDQSCLDCHSTVERAPAEMVKLYGSSNGFGWKMGDIVGAQIVSVPATLTQRLAADAFRNILVITIAAVTALLIVANVAFIWLVPKVSSTTPNT
jgi:protein-histidine pros-kinase